MNKEQVRDTVTAIVMSTTGKESLEQTDDVVNWADISSVDYIKIIVSIEEEFDFEFEDEDLQIGKFKNFDDLIQYTYERSNQNETQGE